MVGAWPSGASWHIWWGWIAPCSSGVAPGSVCAERAVWPSLVSLDMHQHQPCLQRVCGFGFKNV